MTISNRGLATPSMLTGKPSSKPITISVGSVAVGRVISQTPSGGRAQGSSISPHSIARPQRLSSIEYIFSLVARTGMPCSAA